LAEVLKDGGHAVEALAAGINPRDEGVQLVGNALLLVKRREGQLAIKNILLRHALLTNRPAHYLLPVSEKLRSLEVCQEVFWQQGSLDRTAHEVFGAACADTIW
jgi:hypothetical protein